MAANARNLTDRNGPHGLYTASEPSLLAYPSTAPGTPPRDGPRSETQPHAYTRSALPEVARARALTAPAQVPLPDASGPREATTRLVAHGCWYPSVGPGGAEAAFICDRSGIPQLWAGPVDGDEPRLLDSDPDPVQEVSWSPDGRWIAYTTAPGGGEHTRVLCVRPDGTGRHILAGAEAGSSAHLGCWRPDGSALAVTVATPTTSAGGSPAPAAAHPGTVTGGLPAGWTERDGHAVLLDGAAHPRTDPNPSPTWRDIGSGLGSPDGSAPGYTGAARADGGSATSFSAHDAETGDALSAYLIDPDGLTAPTLLLTEPGAATLRVCDLSRDGTLALLRRGPRGHREAVVLPTVAPGAAWAMRVADGDPWIGRFSPDGRTLWLRSDAGREFAALFAVDLGPGGRPDRVTAVAAREDCDLELLAFADHGRLAVLAWNVRGAGELEIAEVFPAEAGTVTSSVDAAPPAGGAGSAGTASPGPAEGTPRTGPARPVPLPHEVVTRVAVADEGLPVLAMSGSQRRPGVWWLTDGGAPARTPWSSRDEDAVPPGLPPVRPVPLSPTARDGLPLSGWYYRAPGRAAGELAPCVIHLHGGPEEQERPVFNPLYHELLSRGLDVFAPDVRGSSGHGRSFVDADLGEGRFAALDDVADCAAHTIVTGLADPARLAVMGRSYGGYLTFASLVWHPDLFRTGVAVCGMSDFATFFEGTEPWIAQSAAHKYGHPERDRHLLRSLSPMTRIDALRVPLLAVHGEHDTNVPPTESEQFVRAARERGLPAQLLTLRDEGHDFLRADNRRLFRRAAADWLQRHLTG
ncbi:S9 family peptidase [Streptomyces sp. NPDC054842]